MCWSCCGSGSAEASRNAFKVRAANAECKALNQTFASVLSAALNQHSWTPSGECNSRIRPSATKRKKKTIFWYSMKWQRLLHTCNYRFKLFITVDELLHEAFSIVYSHFWKTFEISLIHDYHNTTSLYYIILFLLENILSWKTYKSTNESNSIYNFVLENLFNNFITSRAIKITTFFVKVGFCELYVAEARQATALELNLLGVAPGSL